MTNETIKSLDELAKYNGLHTLPLHLMVANAETLAADPNVELRHEVGTPIEGLSRRDQFVSVMTTPYFRHQIAQNSYAAMLAGYDKELAQTREESSKIAHYSGMSADEFEELPSWRQKILTAAYINQ